MESIIKKGKLENNIYFLPDIKLDRKQYQEVAKHLEFLGGKWNRSKKGFIFDRDIENIDELLGDKSKDKKRLQLFETPPEIADYLVELAEIDDLKTVLEPSAGRGRIIRAIQKATTPLWIHYCEINEVNRKYLSDIKNTYLVANNFLETELHPYTRIIANPPFSKNQDIDHIFKMYAVLEKGGILVSVASTHWKNSKNKKETEFRHFLEEVKAEIIDLKENDFKESGTAIKSVIVKIRK